jgi:hypothetical protein
MTDKNAKKLMDTLGIPADKQTALLAASNDDDKDFDISEFLEGAKKFSEPLIKPGIEKEARKAGASGAISKVLEAVYNSVKDETTGSLEEWKKSVEAKDYADVVKESIASSKLKGVSTEQAVKELSTKLAAALKLNEESAASIQKIETEWQSKLEQRDLADAIKTKIGSFKQKAINEKTPKYFLNDLQESGIEIRLHDGEPTLFKKGDTVPLQDEKKLSIVTLEKKYSDWAEENKGLFVQSAGASGGGGGADPVISKKGTIDESKGTITYPGHRPIPVED